MFIKIILIFFFGVNVPIGHFPKQHHIVKTNKQIITELDPISIKLSDDIVFENTIGNQFSFENYDKIVNFKLNDNLVKLINSNNFNWKMTLNTSEHLKSNIKNINFDETFETNNLVLEEGVRKFCTVENLPFYYGGHSKKYEWPNQPEITFTKGLSSELKLQFVRPTSPTADPNNNEIFLNYRSLTLSKINLLLIPKFDKNIFENLDIDLEYKFGQNTNLNDIFIDKIKQKLISKNIPYATWISFFDEPKLDDNIIEQNTHPHPNYSDNFNIPLLLKEPYDGIGKNFPVASIKLYLCQIIDLNSISLNNPIYTGTNITEVLDNVYRNNFEFKQLLSEYCTYLLEGDYIIFTPKLEYKNTILNTLKSEIKITPNPNPNEPKKDIATIIINKDLGSFDLGVNQECIIDQIKILNPLVDEEFLSNVTVNVDFELNQVTILANSNSSKYKGSVQLIFQTNSDLKKDVSNLVENFDLGIIKDLDSESILNIILQSNPNLVEVPKEEILLTIDETSLSITFKILETAQKYKGQIIFNYLIDDSPNPKQKNLFFAQNKIIIISLVMIVLVLTGSTVLFFIRKKRKQKDFQK